MPLVTVWDQQRAAEPIGIGAPNPPWWEPAQRILDRLDRLSSLEWVAVERHGARAAAALLTWGDGFADDGYDTDAALQITLRFRHQRRDGLELPEWIERRGGAPAVASIAACLVAATWPNLPDDVRAQLCGPLRSLMEDA